MDNYKQTSCHWTLATSMRTPRSSHVRADGLMAYLSNHMLGCTCWMATTSHMSLVPMSWPNVRCSVTDLVCGSWNINLWYKGYFPGPHSSKARPHGGPPKQYPTKSHVSPPPSSIGDYPHLDAWSCLFSFEYWPDEKNDSSEHNVHLAECARLATLAIQCTPEGSLAPRDHLGETCYH